MPITTPSAPQSITAVTLNVTSAGTPATVSQTFNDPATLASLKLGQNSLPITNQAILGRYTTPGLQCSNMLSVEYTGYMDVNSVTVSTPALVSNFVATPITLSNFGPFTRDFVSGGTFTLPQPTSNSNSPGTFSYSVPNNNGVVSISGNVVTMLAVGSTTITAIQAAAGGYASSTPITASLNVVAPVDTSLYSISNPPFRTALSNFPRLGAMTNWEMSIRFTVTGGSGIYRSLIGDMYNSVNSSTRGWGVWVSASNGIHFSWSGPLPTGPFWDAPSVSVAMNTDYILKLTRTPTSLTVLLTTVSSGATQSAVNTAMSDTSAYVMSVKGPVTVGGFINTASENFIGTISSVTVTNPDAGITTFTTSNILARYDASAAANYVVNVNKDVTQWTDLTGNGNNLVKNGSIPMPTPMFTPLFAATINSLPALNFNPLRGLICPSVPLATSFTVFMVVKYSTLITTWGNFMHHGNRDADWSIRRNSESSSNYNIDFASWGNGFAELPASTNTNYIIVARYITNTVNQVVTGRARELWLYSDTEIPLKTPVRNSGTVTAGYKPLYVGRSQRADFAEGCNSNIGEILYYSAALSDTDVAQNVAYLSNKWLNYKQ
jgi:hypothetical protein